MTITCVQRRDGCQRRHKTDGGSTVKFNDWHDGWGGDGCYWNCSNSNLKVLKEKKPMVGLLLRYNIEGV